jgi:nucleoside-diphosphate-sugar epimerase
MKVLLTGASGFVGRSIMGAALLRNIDIRPVFRSVSTANSSLGAVVVTTLDGETEWSHALQGVDVVVHAAARAHVMKDKELDPLSEYRRVNVEGSLNLAIQAAAAGVRRFVFISSIKVNGESTKVGRAFAADDVPAPQDAYGISKAEAEAALKLVADGVGMEVTIIRSPLVYGPKVKGNFSNLIQLIRKGVPLPLLAANNNLRSLVALDNLVDLILVCIYHPRAANQTFLISDGEDLSTTDLLRRMAKAINRSARLFFVPSCLLYLVANMLGKKVVAQRLLGSLQVDISKTCEILDWKPPVTVDDALYRAMK